MKLDNFNQIAALKKPVYPEDGTEEITFVDPVLMSEQELSRFTNGDGKGLKWINQFQPIRDLTYSAESTTDEFGNKKQGLKMYKGQWRLAGMKKDLDASFAETGRGKSGPGADN